MPRRGVGFPILRWISYPSSTPSSRRSDWPITNEYVFLSYASADRERARRLAEAMQGKGYQVWWDRECPGQTFDDVIEEALNTATCVVVLWSSASVKSNWVKTEAAERPAARFWSPLSSMPSGFRLNSAECRLPISRSGTVAQSIPSSNISAGRRSGTPRELSTRVVGSGGRLHSAASTGIGVSGAARGICQTAERIPGSLGDAGRAMARSVVDSRSAVGSRRLSPA